MKFSEKIPLQLLTEKLFKNQNDNSPPLLILFTKNGKKDPFFNTLSNLALKYSNYYTFTYTDPEILK